MFAGVGLPQTLAIISARPGDARNILGVQSAVPPSAKALLPAAMLVFLAAAAGARVVAANLRAGADGSGFFHGGGGFADNITRPLLRL